MRHATRPTIRPLVLAGLLVLGPLPCVSAAADDHDRAIERAVSLLPSRPDRIVLLDMDTASPALREKLRRVEGFVTTGERTVYLKRQGFALTQAAKGPGFFDYVVAIKIWHEMAHIDGADEVEAQRLEEELWREFIVSRRVDGRRGLAYLDLLRKRREPSTRQGG